MDPLDTVVTGRCSEGRNEYASRLITPVRAHSSNREIGAVDAAGKKPRLCVCVCKNNNLFSNPYHRSPRCQPELSHSPLALGTWRADKHESSAPHTHRGTLALVGDTLGFGLICPLMLQPCNTTWRDMQGYWNKQTHAYFPPPCQVRNLFWADFSSLHNIRGVFTCSFIPVFSS